MAVPTSGDVDLSATLGSNKRIFKVVLLGEVNVGKTSLFQRLRTRRFQEWGTTVGVDQLTKDYVIDDTTVTLQIWDTAGSEKYRTLTANYYHSATACVYVYDLSALESLYNLSTWADDARRFEPRHCMFLVGNKSDLPEDDIALEDSTIQSFSRELEFKLDVKRREVTGELADTAGRSQFLLGLLRPSRQPCRKQRACWRVSAKTGADVDNFFDSVARTLLERAGGVRAGSETAPASRVRLEDSTQDKRGCAC